MKNIKSLMVAFLIVLSSFFLPAITFGQSSQNFSTLTLSVRPEYEMPLLGSEEYFESGLGGNFSFAYKPPISFPLYASLDLGYTYRPLKIEWANPLHTATAGGGIGMDYRFLGRLAADIYIKGGYYETAIQNLDGEIIYGGNPYIAAGGGFSFYLSPRFRIGFGSSYKQLFGKPDDLAKGVTFYLGSSYRFPLSGSIDIEPVKEEHAKIKLLKMKINNIFPVFYKYYDDHPIGKAALVNEERGEIKNIAVSFFIKQYMDNPKTYKILKPLKKGGTRWVDVYALFNEKVLNITEGTKVSSELSIEYDFKDNHKKKTLITTVSIANRNASIWDDDRRAAAFITARDPVVLKLSKNLAGIIREEQNRVFGKNLMLLAAVHNALSIYGTTYVIDPNTPYKDFHEKKEAVDFLQFPRQTLEYKAGDCDDLSILYSSLLEASSVSTALITVPGHIYIAADLGITPKQAKDIFYNTNDLIIRNNRVWLPFEVTMIQAPFSKAWKEGAREWNKYLPLKKVGFYPVADAWRVFEPVGLPGSSSGIELPRINKVKTAFSADLNSVVRQEIKNKAEDLKTRIAKSGSFRLINRLGILYARYSLYGDAESQFKRLLEKTRYRETALINIGNIRYKKGDFNGALKYYKKVEENQTDNSKLLLNISRTYYQLGKFQDARKLYEQVSIISPELAREYQYLGTKNEITSRASNAEEEGNVLWQE